MKALNTGAVGILIDPEEIEDREHAFSSIMKDISIHPVCRSEFSQTFTNQYHSLFNDNGPGYFVYTNLNDIVEPDTNSILVIDSEEEVEPALNASGGIIVTKCLTIIPSLKKIRDNRRSYKPIFSEDSRVSEAANAMRAGAEGLILLFMPTANELVALSMLGDAFPSMKDCSEEDIKVGILALQGDFLLQRNLLLMEAKSLIGQQRIRFAFS